MHQKNYFTRFLLFFFQLLYHQFAWCYDFIATLVSAGQWKRWVLSIEKFITGPNILEIAHGPGHLQTHLLNAYPLLIGLDESRQMGRQAQKNIRNRYPGLANPLVRAVAQSIPFKSKQFNTVVTTFPAQFILEDITLKEIQRVLKSDGQLVVLLAVQITGTNLFSRLLKILYALTGETPSQQTQNHIRKTLVKHGFSPQINWLEQRNVQLLLINAQKY